ncbi:MAG: hypothetical protein EPN85_07745, partial [Bacteroidetes bacterium]
MKQQTNPRAVFHPQINCCNFILPLMNVLMSGWRIFLIAVVFFFSLSTTFSQTNTWIPKANYGGGERTAAVGFSIGTKGYIGTGSGHYNGLQKDFWEWDQASNVWTQKANFGGGARAYAVGFSIGTKGYIGTGWDGGINLQDFWEYDPSANAWQQKANFGGVARWSAVGFSIGTKGYIGTGGAPGGTKDFWEWDQATDTWTQKSNFGAAARYGATGFSIGAKGYIGTASGLAKPKDDFWEWDQASNAWTQKADFPATSRTGAVGFSIQSTAKGYIGTGEVYTTTSQAIDDFWEWDQATNTWTQRANVSGGVRKLAVGFSIGDKGYIGLGMDPPNAPAGHIKQVYDDFWEYTPDTTTACAVTAVISSDPSSTVCVGQQVFISASGGTTYSWNTGVTTANIVAAPSVTTTYSVMITDAAGCTGIGTLTVPVDLNCTATGIAQPNDGALQVNIWPNPSNGEFQVSGIIPIAIGNQVSTIEIYNVFGERVYEVSPGPKGSNTNTPLQGLGANG